MKFTKENAQHYAKLSHAPTSARHMPKALAAIKAHQIPHNSAESATVIDDFTVKRLARVRKQLKRIDDMLDEATDSKTLKELSDATTRLAEQERQLSGRPLPGTLRPDKPKSKPAQLPPAPDTQ